MCYYFKMTTQGSHCLMLPVVQSLYRDETSLISLGGGGGGGGMKLRCPTKGCVMLDGNSFRA